VSPHQLLSRTKMETEHVPWDGEAAYCLLSQSLALLRLSVMRVIQIYHFRDAELPQMGWGSCFPPPALGGGGTLRLRKGT